MRVRNAMTPMKYRNNKRKLSLILGSGFSKNAGLPTTAEIPGTFLNIPPQTVLTDHLEKEISKILRNFWKTVFGYKKRGTPPSLEDYFTLLDLAANSGHHLGEYYSPKRLRAIRRMSIHRVFHLVKSGYRRNKHIRKMLRLLNKEFDLSVVTLNWDIAVERHLEKYSNPLKIPFHYPIETFGLTGTHANRPWPHTGIPLMKLHGSTNWIYCDSCRRLYSGRIASTALNRKTFLEPDDFRLFNVKPKVVNQLVRLTHHRDCLYCGNKLAGRVATFSYRKAFSIKQFQAIWERAHSYLREADIWLMIGYSLPKADFEFLHLLKSAQLARKKPKSLFLEVVIGGEKSTVNRYKEVFGIGDSRIKRDGLITWIKNDLDRFIGDNK